MEGLAIARKGRGGGELVSMVTLHGVVARGQPAGDDDRSRCGRGEKWGWLGQLSLG
jgi:hypothetical protein